MESFRKKVEKDHKVFCKLLKQRYNNAQNKHLLICTSWKTTVIMFLFKINFSACPSRQYKHYLSQQQLRIFSIKRLKTNFFMESSQTLKSNFNIYQAFYAH